MHFPSRQMRIAGALVLALAAGGSVAGQQQPGLPGSIAQTGVSASTAPPQLRDVTFAQQLGAQLPLETPFRDEAGREVLLGDYFGDKPVLMAFVYYSCPMLCTQIMNGVSSALTVMNFEPGRDFEIVLVSFDTRDTPDTADTKKRDHLEYWSQEAAASGWHFLTGEEDAIARVTAAAGFSYRWEERTQQFAHVSGVVVATPSGQLSRYFYGVEFSPRDLRLALVESGESQIGSLVDELLLYCFHYDPEAGKYGVVVMNVMRLGAAVTLALLGGFIFLMWRRESQASVETHV